MLKIIANHSIFIILLIVNCHPTLSQIEYTSSDIPIIIIDTDTPEQEYSVDSSVTAHMKIINNTDKRNFLSDSSNDYDGKISLKVRGSSSQVFPKKQYRIETQKNNGDNNNVSILGLPVENDWILSAPYSDKSLIRNVFTYHLSKNLGHYAPRTKFCEVIINNDYKGVYILTEKIKRDKNRVDISKLDPDEINGKDLTGGYLLKIDRPDENNCPVVISDEFKILLQFEYPKCEDIADPQVDYIKNYINDFEHSLLYNGSTEYGKYIDINSFIDFFITSELAKNIDAYRLSTFLYKDKNQKLAIGPVWDFNIAFGNINYLEGYKTSGYNAENINEDWFHHLLKDSSFVKKLSDRWSSLREHELSSKQLFKTIDSLGSILNESIPRNFQRWQTLGDYVWPNYVTPSTYEGEITYLKSWIVNRLNWMDISLKQENSFNSIENSNYDMSIYPNPFNLFFTINFTLATSQNVTLKLTDSHGRLVEVLEEDKHYEAGEHKLVWTNFDNEKPMKNSLYIITLEVDGVIVNRTKVSSIF